MRIQIVTFEPANSKMFLSGLASRSRVPRATVLRLRDVMAKPIPIPISPEPTIVTFSGTYILRVLNAGSTFGDIWTHHVPDPSVGFPATMHLPTGYAIAFICDPRVHTRLHMHTNGEIHMEFADANFPRL